MAILALDFGTSNSAAAMLREGQVLRLPIEEGADTLPTAVFFPAEGGPMRIGEAAVQALIGGEEGRFMRAMKSALGTSLFDELRPIAGKRRKLSDVVTAFLRSVKERAEAAAGQGFDRLLCGRPVHFHNQDPARDERAEAHLRACCLAAGFREVSFRLEPEAAALASHGEGQPGEVGLIVDIGGGTSDFTVFRSGNAGLQVLASHGVRLGGTDFDRAISMGHAMPRLGLGSQLRREMGQGLLPVPRHLYLDLATWAKIPFLYTPETRAQVAEMVKLAEKPRLMRRLDRVVRAELGHDLAFAVEAGKIAANSGAEGAVIDMGRIEPGLTAPLSRASLDRVLARHRAFLAEAAGQACAMAGVAPGAVEAVVLVGGSSLMAIVAEMAAEVFPQARLRGNAPFTAVVDGLALATA